MTPQTLDIVIYRGDDFIQPLTCVDANGTAVSISGWSFTGTLRRSADGGSIASFTFTVVSAAAGTVDLKMVNTATDDLVAGEYVYDAQRDNGSGDIRTIVKGKATVIADVTHA